MDPNKTGRMISERRKTLNMTQKELAKKLYITDKAISKWERGLSFPDIATLIPLTEILNINLYDLLKGESMKKDEVEQTLKETIEYSNKEIKKTKQKYIKIIISIFVVFILLLFTYLFAKNYEMPVKYREDMLDVKIPVDEGIDIRVSLLNYTKMGSFLVKMGEDNYDLYINVTQTLMTKIFKDNNMSNNFLRVNYGITDYQSHNSNPNEVDDNSIKRIFYINKILDKEISEEELIHYKDKTLIWERD